LDMNLWSWGGGSRKVDRIGVGDLEGKWFLYLGQDSRDGPSRLAFFLLNGPITGTYRQTGIGVLSHTQSHKPDGGRERVVRLGEKRRDR
jgi:hypothetical protein